MRRAFAPLALERLEALGLVETDGGRRARPRPDRPARRPADRLRPAPARATDDAGPRRRRPRPVADALAPDRAAAGRDGARRRHRAAASRRSSPRGTRARRRDRPQRARAELRRVQRRCSTAPRTSSSAPGASSSPSRGERLRARRLQPAVRDLAGVGVPLPRQRPRGRQRSRAQVVERSARGARGGGFATDARQLGAPAGRGLVGAAARLGRRQRLRRAAAPLRHRGSAHARGDWKRDRFGDDPDGARRGARPLARVLRAARDRGHRATAPSSCAAARRRRTGFAPHELPATGLRPAASTSCACSTQPTTSPALGDDRALLDERLALADARPRRAARPPRVAASGRSSGSSCSSTDGLRFQAGHRPADRASARGARRAPQRRRGGSRRGRGAGFRRQRACRPGGANRARDGRARISRRVRVALRSRGAPGRSRLRRARRRRVRVE